VSYGRVVGMKKSAFSLFFIGLIVVSLVIVATGNLSTAQTSGTNVNGIIAQDTTWTPAGSPYTFTGPVAINAGVTLTIQAGVGVNMGNNEMTVNGTLSAIGTPTNPITINWTSYGSGNDMMTHVITFNPSSSGSILQYTNLNSVTIQINGASPTIDHSNFFCRATFFVPAINTQGGSAIVSNNVFWDFRTGLGLMLDTSVVSNNIFIRSRIAVSSNSTITGNTISAVSEFPGVDAANNDNSTLAGNLIVNCVSSGSGTPSAYGIALTNRVNTIVENNTIYGNSAGIGIRSNSTNALIQHNNIYGNLYNIYLASGSDLVTNNNWWGTTDTQAINQTMYDYKNDYNRGNVSFVPFLIAPNIQAPTFIDATAGDRGSIAPSGIVSVSYGGSQTFSITPNSGYQIANVLVNGSSVGAVNSYTVQNINGATTVSATFALIPTPTPPPTQAPTTNPTANNNPSASPASTPSPTPTVPEFQSIIAVLVLLVVSSAALIDIKKNRHHSRVA
jgi:hypothetical protein